MSTFDYAELRAEVTAILTEFGNALVLTRESTGATYNPVTGANTGGAPTNVNGIGVLVGYKAREIDGQSILATDRKLIFSGDEVNKNDKYGEFRVYELNRIDPDESGTILTIAQMRR